MERVLVAAYAGEASPFVRLRSVTANMRWIVAEEDRIVAGCVYAITYGEVAYVGLMAVHPAAQRRGIGEALMNDLLAFLDARGVRTALLDATESGARLYARLGFTEIDTVTIYGRDDRVSSEKLPADARLRLGVSSLEIAHADRLVWNCDRGEILDTFLREAQERAAVSLDRSGCVDGYVLVRGRIVGPWQAENEASAERLLQHALSTSSASPRVYVPSQNAAACALLEQRDFTPQRSLIHMARGAPSPVRRNLLFGQGSAGTG